VNEVAEVAGRPTRRSTMAVRAKMRCTGRREWHDGGQHGGVEVTLQPVYAKDDADKANAEWSKHTPSGELKLNITNPLAFEQIKIGKAYFVDLTPADES
jgi:hypothetical protein